MWGDEFLGFLSSESLLDLWVGVGDHLGLSVGGRGGISLSELNVVGVVESWGMVTLARSPVFDILLVLDGLGLSAGWGSSVLGGVGLKSNVSGGVSLGHVELIPG